MVEMLYSVYKKCTFDQLIKTIIAYTLIENKCEIKNERYHIKTNEYPKSLLVLLRNIKIGKENFINHNQIESIQNEIYQIAIDKKFISHFPIIGIYNNRNFKKYINQNIDKIDHRIITYCKDFNSNILNSINRKINEITFKLPASNNFNSYYNDSTEAFKAYRNSKYLINNDYSYYYTISGNNRKI